jgi:N6-adenosine-specific RNA methylase IME4
MGGGDGGAEAKAQGKARSVRGEMKKSRGALVSNGVEPPTDMAKPTIKLLLATRDVVERDIALGLVKPEQLKLAFADREQRRRTIEELSKQGMSQRQIAKVIGIGKSQIDRDLAAPNGAKNAPNGATAVEAPIEFQPAVTVDKLDTLVSEGRKFGTIYADPPWQYDNQGTRAATSNHYDGLSVEELCALSVRELAADDAHLHLWTTNGFLFECPKIFAAWGFEFRSSFVWVKPQIGIGNYWRNSHEFLLTAIRGNAKHFNDRSLRSWLEYWRGWHSAKPEIVRDYIERASPGPRLELFGREPRNGWVVWGNEIADIISDQSSIGEAAE